ncbi:methyltransferase [Paenibacillus dendritiformis]|uniref:class I SAM-dependent methyltransferase n=1 Tax=Paenibacillus dendritiformis TaxID=130049 RepID=UPI0018CCC02A|nr:class I SAM-dependent methyltransferase [Paenibacillus dendritiformis]MBG9792716.1 methyltransferase [Paenibacillus dendritiformis]
MNKIIDYYNGYDEWGRLDREPLEFMVNCHHIRKHLPPGGHLLDNGAADERFDAALMMGPLYHLQAEEDRRAAVQELYRVTKRGGMVFVAVMSVVRHVMNSLLHPQHWKPNDSIRQIRSFMETGIFDHQDEGRFTGAYYFRVEEIAPFMEAHGFETVQFLGSSSIAGAMNEQQFEYWRSRGEDEYWQAMELIYETASCPYVLGVSSHLLYIGRRK